MSSHPLQLLHALSLAFEVTGKSALTEKVILPKSLRFTGVVWERSSSNWTSTMGSKIDAESKKYLQ